MADWLSHALWFAVGALFGYGFGFWLERRMMRARREVWRSLGRVQLSSIVKDRLR